MVKKGDIVDEHLREHEYNNFLTPDHHLQVAKAMNIIAMRESWLKQEITFHQFRHYLNTGDLISHEECVI